MRRIMRLVVVVVVLLASFLVMGSAPVLAETVHVVRCGETLSSIGRLYGVSLWEIARVNGIADVNRIWVGQVLRIPGCGGPPPAPAPRPGPAPAPRPGPWWGYSYYPTAICVDGTVSHAGYGWGVCAWHGGVRAWVPRRVW